MNISKAQKIIFNQLISSGNVRRFDFDKDNVFITPDCYHGYILPYSSLQVNIDRIPVMKNLDIESVVTEENCCRLSRELVLQEHPKAYLRKLKKGDQSIYFNQKLMDCFQNPKFYCKGPHEMIVITEYISAKRKNAVVGIILPTRVEEAYFK